eukprot:jgi/Phyca11/21801/fgenesh1_pg.PHYCAscaffold_126_\
MQHQHAVIIANFNQTINDLNQTVDDLSVRLAAALLQTAAQTVSPASDQELRRLQSDLDSATAAHAEAQADLDQAVHTRDQLQARLITETDNHAQTQQALLEAQDLGRSLEASNKALEDAAKLLKRQIGSVEQRLQQTDLEAEQRERAAWRQNVIDYCLNATQ